MSRVVWRCSQASFMSTTPKMTVYKKLAAGEFHSLGIGSAIKKN